MESELCRKVGARISLRKLTIAANRTPSAIVRSWSNAFVLYFRFHAAEIFRPSPRSSTPIMRPLR